MQRDLGSAQRANLPRLRAAMRAAAALALPATIWWTGFFLLPFLGLLIMSFGSPLAMPFFDRGAFAGLSFANYAVALQPPYSNVLVATLRTAALGTALCVIAGFPVAYALARVIDQRWRSLLLIVLMLPYWTSFLLRTLAWRIILAPDGPVGSAAAASGLWTQPLALLDTAAAVQIGIVYNYLPLTILPIYVALERIPASLDAAGRDLGASPAVSFCTITLPLAAPGIASAALITFVLAGADYVVPALLGGARGLMIGSLIATQTLAAQNIPLGSALAIVLLLSSMLAVLAAWAGYRTLRMLSRRIGALPA